MAWSYAGSVLARATNASSPTEIFTKLQETYNYNEKITYALIALGLENLDDFPDGL